MAYLVASKGVECLFCNYLHLEYCFYIQYTPAKCMDARITPSSKTLLSYDLHLDKPATNVLAFLVPTTHCLDLQDQHTLPAAFLVLLSYLHAPRFLTP